MMKVIFGFLICMILIFAAVLPVTGELTKIETKDVIDGYPLPPPLPIDMILEESICRRMSVRSFTATISIPSRSIATLNTCLPILPNPLIPIFIYPPKFYYVC